MHPLENLPVTYETMHGDVLMPVKTSLTQKRNQSNNRILCPGFDSLIIDPNQCKSQQKQHNVIKMNNFEKKIKIK